MLGWSLVAGPLPAMLAVAGAAGLLALLIARLDRRWFTRLVPLVVVLAAAGVGVAVVVLAITQPFPDPLPVVVWYSLGAALLAVGLAVTAFRALGATRRVAAVVATVLVLLAAGNQVNLHFGQYPTLRSAMGLPPANQVGFAQVSTASPGLVPRPAGQALSSAWQPPADMPSGGQVTEVLVPGPISGFSARTAWIYLPPAYLATPRAELPVLVLLSGQPGTTRDWLDGGRLSAMMDAFASTHDGLAPVVVIPDWLGSAYANPLCLDSRLGNVQTYLTVDVPAWIRTTLQIDPDPGSWAVGGYSAGGTCALQVAVNAPQVYPTFVDISGQSEPTLGDRTATVQAAFGGDTAAFAAVNPLDQLGRRSYTGVTGFIAAGSNDTVYRPQALQVVQATQQAGMQVVYRELPGGHDWKVWGPALEVFLPQLAVRLRLIP